MEPTLGRLIRALCLIWLASCGDGHARLLLNDNTSYPTIPLLLSVPFQIGVVPSAVGRAPILNVRCVSGAQAQDAATARGAVALYAFTNYGDFVETFVRQIHEQYAPAVIVLRTVELGVGSSKFITAGSVWRGDLTFPVVDVAAEAFDAIHDALQAGAGHNCSLFFEELNPYDVVGTEPWWNAMLVLLSLVQGGCMVYALVNLYRYHRQHVPFENPQLGLIFEAVASLLRLLYTVDLSWTRRLMPYTLMRALTTLYVLPTLGAALVLIVYSGVVLRASMRSKRTWIFTPPPTFMESRVTVYTFASIMLGLGLLEAVNLAISLTRQPFFNTWVTIIYATQVLLIVTVCALYIAVVVVMARITGLQPCRSLRTSSDLVRARIRTQLRDFILRFFLPILGLCCYTVCVGLVGPMHYSDEFVGRPVERLVVLNNLTYFALVGVSLASLVHIYFYAPDNVMPQKSSSGKSISNPRTNATPKTMSMHSRRSTNASEVSALSSSSTASAANMPMASLADSADNSELPSSSSSK
jgi:hypothetical protein